MMLNLWWDIDIVSIKVNYYKNSKKYSMISNIQRMFIIHDYKNKKSFKEIMNKYEVSMSSIFKIIKDYKINKYSNLKIDWNLSENTNFTANEKEFLRKYIQPPQKPLTIWRINNELNNHFEVKDRKCEIKFFLKNELCYSYKVNKIFEINIYYYLNKWNLTSITYRVYVGLLSYRFKEINWKKKRNEVIDYSSKVN